MNSLTYQLSANVAMEVFDDGALILNLEKITFTELNTTARDILQATDGRNDLVEVARILANEYEIEQEIALQDVNELYQELIGQEIIEVVTSNVEKEA
jgi:hypothetical protein